MPSDYLPEADQRHNVRPRRGREKKRGKFGSSGRKKAEERNIILSSAIDIV